jgi:peptide/nickel transport system substrate-binding protein
MRQWQASLGLAAVGFGLLGAAVAHSGIAKDGGTLRVNISAGDIQSVDPAIDYDLVGWTVEYATCVKLLNYPDRPGKAGTRLVPDGAAAMPTVSGDGRTYTFRIRSDLRFNTGDPVTASNFAYAFERALSPKMRSPAAAFLSDVVGANAFLRGKAKHIAGITDSGNVLRISLVRPLADVLARVAIPFFCAVPLDYPIDPQLTKAPASAGPYYIAERTRGRTLTLKRNPYYRGPRPHHLDEIDFTANTDLHASYLQIRAGQVDYDLAPLIPPQQAAALAKQYGVNRSRYFVTTSNQVDYVAFNMSRPLFSGAGLRKAVNFAIDRPALIRQFGQLAGTTTDQILPPGVPGFHDVAIYPLKSPDVARAKRLAGGKGGTAVLLMPNVAPVVGQAQVLAANLAQIGVKVTTRALAPPAYLAALSDPTEPWDMAIAGFAADYPDPFDFVNVLLDSANVPPAGANFSQMRITALDRRMRAAAALRGETRYLTYSRLEANIMRTVAPVAPFANRNAREFVSARYGCHVYQQALSIVDLAAACIR